jgi:hypothetical protein
MKTIDISKNVMGKVVQLEKGRTVWWLRRFVMVIAVLTLTFTILGIMATQIISERQGWDLLTLFQQDQEIIVAYWQDTLWTFWEEAPHQVIYALIVTVILVISIIILTRRSRMIVRKKLHQIEKYRSN